MVCPHTVPVVQGTQTPAVDFCSVCIVVVSVVIFRLGGLTAVILKFIVSLVVNPFMLVDVHRRFGGTYFLRNHRCTLMSDAAGFSEMSILVRVEAFTAVMM